MPPVAPLSFLELEQVGRQIAHELGGQPVQKVILLDQDTVAIDLRRRWLVLSVHPRLGRLHLLATKPSGTGQVPPAFCMLLRKHLEGARLQSVVVVPGERAVELQFTRVDGKSALRLFLFGRAAQLQLVDSGEMPRILGHLGPARRVYEALPPAREGSAPPSRFGEDPSRAIEQLFTLGVAAAAAEEHRHAALQKLHDEGKRLARLHLALVKDLDRMNEVPRLRKEADLLLALAGRAPNGQSSIVLADLIDGGEAITIQLDPSLSAVDNAQRRYKQSRRLERGQKALSARLDRVADDLARVRAEAHRVEEGGVVEAPLPGPRVDKSGKKARKRAPYRAYRSQLGVPILVGRGAEKNDELTFKVARGNDWWLHTRDVAGAHVVIALGGRPLDEATLLDAATLAVHFSSLRDEAQVDVSYVQRKAVKKPPRSRPGLVTHSGAKTLRVRMERDRLARLIATLEEDVHK